MPKYSSFGAEDQEQIRKARNEVHPIWRGVGVILIVLTPVLGYFAALVVLDENTKNKWFAIPQDFLYKGADPLLLMKIGLTIILGLLIYFVLQFLTFLLYSLFGPSRYGPYDVPPVAYKGKKHTR